MLPLTFNPKKILIIRPDGIGDLVLTLPAIQAVKEKFPAAKISVLVRENNRAIVAHHPAIDQVITGYDLKKYGFDLSINFYNELKDTFAVWRAGIPYRLGDSSRILLAWMNNLRVFRNWQDQSKHEVEQNLALLKPLGIAAPPPDPIIIVDKAAKERTASLVEGKTRLAGIHCGSVTSQSWPPEKFAAAAKFLIENNYTVLLLGGEKEQAAAKTIFAANPSAVDLTGKLPLADLIAIISRLNFFLGMDSGPAHLAAVFKVPEVMIMLNPVAKPARWHPWRTKYQTVAVQGEKADVSVAEVIAAIRKVFLPGSTAARTTSGRSKGY